MKQSLQERIREEAVESVDKRHGYTMEHAPSPAQHRAEYNREEELLRAEYAEDPGRAICGHDHRVHYLGGGGNGGEGGILVCFACWLSLVLGRKVSP